MSSSKGEEVSCLRAGECPIAPVNLQIAKFYAVLEIEKLNKYILEKGIYYILRKLAFVFEN